MVISFLTLTHQIVCTRLVKETTTKPLSSHTCGFLEHSCLVTAAITMNMKIRKMTAQSTEETIIPGDISGEFSDAETNTKQ